MASINQTTTAKMMLNRTATQKPVMLNPAKRAETNQIIRPFIIKVNKPRVNRFIGNVKTTKIGLIIALTTPRTKEAITAAQKLSILAPGINQALTKKAKVLISQVRSNFIGYGLIMD